MVAALAEEQAAAVVAEGAATLADPRAPVDAPVPDAPSDSELRCARWRERIAGKWAGHWR